MKLCKIFVFHKINEFFKVYDALKYLTLSLIDEKSKDMWPIKKIWWKNKNVLKKHEEIWN